MNKNRYQSLADKICLNLGLPFIPILDAVLPRRVFGTYESSQIKIKAEAGQDTVLHELAHYLQHFRYLNHIPGYFKVFVCPMMEELSDKPGWYAATGSLHEVYCMVDYHGRTFRNCLKKIEESCIYCENKGESK